MTVVTSNNKEHRWMCFIYRSCLTKSVISQYVNMSAYFQIIGTNKPGTSWNSRAGVSLKARFTERNKKKLTFVTVPVRRSDVPVVVASYCLTTYGPLLHVAASECHLIAHVLLMRTAWPLPARRTNIFTGTGLNPRTRRHVTGIQWYYSSLVYTTVQIWAKWFLQKITH